MGFSEVELTIVGMPTIIGDQERLEISDPLDKDGWDPQISLLQLLPRDSVEGLVHWL